MSFDQCGCWHFLDQTLKNLAQPLVPKQGIKYQAVCPLNLAEKLE